MDRKSECEGRRKKGERKGRIDRQTEIACVGWLLDRVPASTEPQQCIAERAQL